MNKKLKVLWDEKKKYDEHSERPVLQASEWDSIANAILSLVKTDVSVASSLTAEDLKVVKWAHRRLGLDYKGA